MTLDEFVTELHKHHQPHPEMATHVTIQANRGVVNLNVEWFNTPHKHPNGHPVSGHGEVISLDTIATWGPAEVEAKVHELMAKHGAP